MSVLARDLHHALQRGEELDHLLVDLLESARRRESTSPRCDLNLAESSNTRPNTSGPPPYRRLVGRVGIRGDVAKQLLDCLAVGATEEL